MAITGGGGDGMMDAGEEGLLKKFIYILYNYLISQVIQFKNNVKI